MSSYITSNDLTVLSSGSFQNLTSTGIISGPRVGPAVITNIITSSGTYLFSSLTRSALVQLWGGGAGGSSVQAVTPPVFGAAGGSGAYCERFINLVEPSIPYNITIGSGGTSDSNGNPSVFSTTITNSINITPRFVFSMTAGGGLASPDISVGALQQLDPGAGGTATSSQLSINGQSSSTNRSASHRCSCAGGDGPLGIGMGGWQRAMTGAGINGIGYAAGGGGAATASGGATAYDGGTGAPGVCIVTEYL